MRVVRQHGRDALPLSVPQLAIDKAGADDVFFTCAAPGLEWQASGAGTNLSLWFRATAIGPTNGTIFLVRRATTSLYILRLDNATTMTWFTTDSAPSIKSVSLVLGAGSFLDGAWRHVCARTENNAVAGLDLYLTVDGTEASALAQGALTVNTDAPAVAYCMHQGTAVNTELVGSVADIRYEYGRMWTSDECTALRQQGPQSRATIGTLTAWMPDPLQGQKIGASTWAQSGAGTALTNLAISHAALRK